MTHFHLDLHVNKHAVTTVILSSIAVIGITIFEYTNLNSALAYEKETIYETYQIQKDVY